MILIVMTVVLSMVILVAIWFPDLITGNIVGKIFRTYLVLFLSSAIISKMTTYLERMSSKEKASCQEGEQK